MSNGDQEEVGYSKKLHVISKADAHLNIPRTEMTKLPCTHPSKPSKIMDLRENHRCQT
jgi:hypothetical protein